MAKEIFLLMVCATAGGFAARFLNLPSPWLIGGLTTAGALSILHKSATAVPHWLTKVATLAIGVSIGSSIDVTLSVFIDKLNIAVTLMIFLTPSMFIISFSILRFMYRWDLATAIWSSLPGALSISVSMAMQTIGNTERIAIVQITRLYLSVLFVGLYFTGSLNSEPQTFMHSSTDATLYEIVGALGLSIIVGIIFERLGVPAGMLIGALLTTVMSNAAFDQAIPMPPWFVAVAQLLLAVVVGNGLSGFNRSLMRTVLVPSIVSFFGVGIFWISATYILSTQLGVPPRALILAFAPGGIETMSVFAMTTGADPGLTLSSHTIRLFIVLAAAPFLAIAIAKRGILEPRREALSSRETSPSDHIGGRLD